MEKPICPCCVKPATVTPRSVFQPEHASGFVWGCQPCGFWVGYHLNSPTLKPLGVMANADHHRARDRAAKAFAQLMQAWAVPRRKMCEWLADRIYISLDRCDFGKMTETECNRAWSVCVQYIPDFNERRAK